MKTRVDAEADRIGRRFEVMHHGVDDGAGQVPVIQECGGDLGMRAAQFHLLRAPPA